MVFRGKAITRAWLEQKEKRLENEAKSKPAARQSDEAGIGMGAPKCQGRQAKSKARLARLKK